VVCITVVLLYPRYTAASLQHQPQWYVHCLEMVKAHTPPTMCVMSVLSLCAGSVCVCMWGFSVSSGCLGGAYAEPLTHSQQQMPCRPAHKPPWRTAGGTKLSLGCSYLLGQAVGWNGAMKRSAWTKCQARVMGDWGSFIACLMVWPTVLVHPAYQRCRGSACGWRAVLVWWWLWCNIECQL
jgi:hypothetical protein